MNPLFLKVGLPVAILAALAFMRWTNKKSMGEPFFPTDDSSAKTKGGGGGATIAPPLRSTQDIQDGVTTPNEVQDSGTYDEYSSSSYSDPVADSVSFDPVSNLGVGGGTAGRGGLSVNTGGVVSYSPAIQSLLDQRLTSPQSAPQTYVPYVSSTPTTQPVANQFGGQGGGHTYAM